MIAQVLQKLDDQRTDSDRPPQPIRLRRRFVSDCAAQLSWQVEAECVVPLSSRSQPIRTIGTMKLAVRFFVLPYRRLGVSRMGGRV